MAENTLRRRINFHPPALAWDFPPVIPEGRGADVGVQSHTDHTQALGEQYKRQQEPIQEGLVRRKENKRRALLQRQPEGSTHHKNTAQPQHLQVPGQY